MCPRTILTDQGLQTWNCNQDFTEELRQLNPLIA